MNESAITAARRRRGRSERNHSMKGNPMRNRLRNTLAAVAASSFVALSSVALAQPAHSHGGPAHGQDFARVFAGVKSQLNLNTSQQAMWDAAVAQSKAGHDAARANLDKVRTAVSTELAKAEPDLAAIAAASDEAQAANTTIRKQVRSQWLALYATFSAEQKAVVKDALGKRIARIEQFRERMMQRHGN
jgi:Spy/CpxP family protein refolding chaperone